MYRCLYVHGGGYVSSDDHNMSPTGGWGGYVQGGYVQGLVCPVGMGMSRVWLSGTDT